MIFDSHSHTAFSADSEMRAQDALKNAQERGVGIVFTEHLDLDYPGELDFTFDPHAYWQAYEPLRGEGVRLGVEIGMWEQTRERSAAFAKEVPFDLVIGAIHLVDGDDIYYPEFYAGRQKAEVYHRYYEQMAENLRRHDFVDVLAHIDYIARYAPYDNPEISYGDFREDIDDVLRAVIETGTVLELNTRRLGSRRALKELVPVYQRYRELGGRYVTVGSDAHTADAVACHFHTAEELVDTLGLQIVTFCSRQLEFCQQS
ncbi:histidinol-phosphatase HisJ family protein [Mitsuokella sp. AF21-1AC]|uniref:histidinol-phosphatase HisJ family protein n=1 Tax=Mitsuokella sp. AF21-1AC TaxID=2292235 RepID=UPI000E512B89|nr:histidinol-phosphatase HisJ family protein [Mitsuokella sp. AF21-1AC]RGS73722.1 PHP domain-containing protein [Mitsuokella sp. AF21-1AC]